MAPYLLAKGLHVLSSTVLFGTGMDTALHWSGQCGRTGSRWWRM